MSLIDDLRAIKRSSINAQYDTKRFADITVAGHAYQADEPGQLAIVQVLAALDIRRNYQGNDDPEDFPDASGTMQSLDSAEMMALHGAICERALILYRQWRNLHVQIDAALTGLLLDLIVWP